MIYLYIANVCLFLPVATS